MSERLAAGSGEEIRLERDGAVGYLVIDRPAQRNALSIPACEKLHKLLDEVEADDSLRVLVVTGTGPKSFIAGADISELVTYDPAKAYYHIEVGHKLFTRLERLPKATIASVNGYCLGGGLEIAMACDIRLASENAKFGLPEINIGMVPGWGGTERLQRLIGQSRALAMALSGEMIDINEAKTCGLVYRSFADVPALRAGTDEFAQKLAKFSPITMKATKTAILDAVDMSQEQIVQRDSLTLAYLFTTFDAVEGLKAFLEKRPADYQGR